MRNSKTIVITAVLFALLSTGFAMSGDGGQQPVKQEKGTEVVQVQQFEKSVQEPLYAQVEQPEETDSGQEGKSGESVTVKDQFGIDTGMTKEELEKFKEEYLKRHKNNSLYNAKIDPAKFIELRNLGVEVSKFGVVTNYIYQNNTLFSDIIIIGKTVKTERGLGLLVIEEILKGSDILMNKLGAIPMSIFYGYGAGGRGFTDPVIGERGLYFFAASYALSHERPYLQRKAESTTILNISGNIALHEDLYNIEKNRLEALKKQAEEGNKRSTYILKTFDEVVENVKKIIEVNDHKNFYKKTFKAGGKK